MEISRENVVALKSNLKELDSLQLLLSEKKKEFEKENEVLLGNISKVKGYIDTIKEKITSEAKEEFLETNKKKLLGGIGIKETSSISYDAEKAFEWAKKTGTCLLLDKKKFEKVGVEMVDFIEVSKSITVTFPKEIKLDD